MKATHTQRIKELVASLRLKNLDQSTVNLLESQLKNKDSLISKVATFIRANSELQDNSSTAGLEQTGLRTKTQNIFSKTSQLGLNDHPSVHNLFKTLSEDPEQHIKFARLKRAAFKSFLQERYTTLFGDRIL